MVAVVGVPIASTSRTMISTLLQSANPHTPCVSLCRPLSLSLTSTRRCSFFHPSVISSLDSRHPHLARLPLQQRRRRAHRARVRIAARTHHDGLPWKRCFCLMNAAVPLRALLASSPARSSCRQLHTATHQHRPAQHQGQGHRGQQPHIPGAGYGLPNPPTVVELELRTGLRVLALTPSVVVVDKPAGLRSIPAFGPASSLPSSPSSSSSSPPPPSSSSSPSTSPASAPPSSSCDGHPSQRNALSRAERWREVLSLAAQDICEARTPPHLASLLREPLLALAKRAEVPRNRGKFLKYCIGRQRNPDRAHGSDRSGRGEAKSPASQSAARKAAESARVWKAERIGGDDVVGTDGGGQRRGRKRNHALRVSVDTALALWDYLSKRRIQAEDDDGVEESDSVIGRLKLHIASATPVHRLDRYTSGVLAVALTPDAASVLSAQWRARSMPSSSSSAAAASSSSSPLLKDYVAVVQGVVTADEGLLTFPLAVYMSGGGSQPIHKIMVVGTLATDVSASSLGPQQLQAKACETRFRVLARDHSSECTLLALEPVTGRMHQLRAHLLAFGHPILGDEVYAPAHVAARSSRLMLHARSLEFVSPEGVTMRAVTPLPDEFAAIFEELL